MKMNIKSSLLVSSHPQHPAASAAAVDVWPYHRQIKRPNVIRQDKSIGSATVCNSTFVCLILLLAGCFAAVVFIKFVASSGQSVLSVHDDD